MAATTERVRRTATEATGVLTRDTVAAPPEFDAGPPEPPGVEPVVHATHVEAPALDAEERYPDLFAGEQAEPEPAEEPGRRGGRRGRPRGGRAGRDRRAGAGAGRARRRSRSRRWATAARA